ncbi:MAG: hypothetical protein ACUZ8E_14520 [Candidatus Anammoxibacter sp.]
MQIENNSIYCDLKNTSLIINGKPIHMPPHQFIIYCHYLQNKTYTCPYLEKDSCKNCTECFSSLFQTAKSSNQLLSFYKQIYGEHSEHYRTLKRKWKRGMPAPYTSLVQGISKINRKIKLELNENADPFIITGVGGYGNKSYGMKLSRNKISISEK